MNTKCCRFLKLSVAPGNTERIIVESLEEAGWKNVQTDGISAVTAVYFIPESSNDGTVARLKLICSYGDGQLDLEVSALNDGIEIKKCESALSRIVSVLEDNSR